MKTREELTLENIEFEHTVMKFKKGLHLAKAYIDADDYDRAKKRDVFLSYLKDNDLEEI